MTKTCSGFLVLISLIFFSICLRAQTSYVEPEPVLQTGHTNTIKTIAWSPRSDWLVTGGNDGTFKIWDANTGRLLRSVTSGEVESDPAVSADGRLIASRSRDESVRIWSVQTGDVIRTFQGKGYAESVTFCAKTGWLVASYHDGLIRVWNPESGDLIREFGEGAKGIGEGLTSIACSSDGQTVAVTGDRGLIQLWDARTGKKLHSFGEHGEHYMLAVAFSPDGRWLAQGGLGGTINLWDLRSDYKQLILHIGGLEVGFLSFSPDSKTLASAAGQVELWDVGSGRMLGTAGAIISSAAAFAPTGNTLAIAAADNSLFLFDPRIPVVLNGHEGKVNSVAWSTDGKMLASASADKTIRLWNASTGELIKSLPSGVGEAASVALSGDGQLIAWGGENGVRVSKLSDFSAIAIRGADCPVGESCAAESLAFSPDSRLLAYDDYGRETHLVDVVGKLENPPLTVGTNAIASSIAFTRDGKFLVSGSFDKSVRVWEIATHQLLRTCQSNGSDINSLAISPDGTWIATGGLSSDVRLWELATCKLYRELRFQSWTPEVVTSISFSPDGRHLIACFEYGDSVSWEILSGRGFPLEALTQAQENGESLAFDPVGRLAEGYSTGVIKIWPPAFDQAYRSLGRRANPLSLVAFAGPGKLVEITSPGEIATWDGGTGNESASSLREDRTIIDKVALSVDGASALAHVYSGGDVQIELLDLRAHVTRWKVLDPNSGITGGTTLLAFAPDGRHLAVVGIDTDQTKSTIRLWDTSNGEEIWRISEHAYTVAFSPDSNQIAASFQNEISIRDVSKGDLIKTLQIENEPIELLHFSATGTRLIVGGKHHIFIFDVASGRLLRILLHGVELEAFATGPDDSILASGGTDGTVKLWNISTGNELHTLTGHSGFVKSISFSSDGRWLASASLDGTVRLWDVQQGVYRATLICCQGSEWTVIAPGGEFDGSPGGWSSVIWRLGNDTFKTAPIEAFFSGYYHPGLLADILAGNASPPAMPSAPNRLADKDLRQPTVTMRVTPANAIDPSSSMPGLSFDKVLVNLKISQTSQDEDHSKASGARDLRLFRNGVLVKAWHGDLPLDETGRFEATVDIPIAVGDNRVTAYAFNRDNVKSEDASVLVNGPESIRRPGKIYILAIGVNLYANPGFDLTYARADAEVFAEVLKREQGKLGVYKKIEIAPLANEQATRAGILEVLARLAGKPSSPPFNLSTVDSSKIQPAQPEDTVFIFFAGHGMAKDQRFYLIPYDLGYAGPRKAINDAAMNSLIQHGISDEDLGAALEGIDAGRMVMVIDACNSGQALEAEEKRRGPMNSKGLAQLAYEKGMYILTAAQGYQEAQEVNLLGHGLLTYALVEDGLISNGAASSDGTIYLRDWFDYATREVPDLQLQWLQEAKKTARGFEFLTKDGKPITDPMELGLQNPRVFYRREPDVTPFVVGHTNASN